MSYQELLHIGANKSASTTLQRCLFPNASEVVYLGEDCNGYEGYRDILNQMISEDSWNYQSMPVEQLFKKHIDLARAQNKAFLYSNEDIMTSRVPSQVLNRLKTLMPDATIIIVIRNQLDAIPSWYANHGAYLKGVPKRFWRRFVTSDEFMDHSIRFFNYGPLDCFMYNKVLSEYAKVFGKEKIKILFFEDFVKNRPLFISQLSSILGMDPKTADELLSNKAERARSTARRFAWHKLSRYLPFLHESNLPRSMKVTIDRLLDSGGKLSAERMGMTKWNSALTEIYKEDNRALQLQFGVDLSKYNYPL